MIVISGVQTVDVLDQGRVLIVVTFAVRKHSVRVPHKPGIERVFQRVSRRHKLHIIIVTIIRTGNVQIPANVIHQILIHRGGLFFQRVDNYLLTFTYRRPLLRR